MRSSSSSSPAIDRSSTEWKLWNRLDLKDEADKFKVANSLHKLLEECQQLIECQQCAMPPLNSITAGLDMLSVEVDDSTLHLPPVLTPEVIPDLLQFFTGGGLLHKKYAQQIIQQACALLEGCPSVAVLPPPSLAHRIAVVGDLHGSFEDLATVLERVGPPGPTTYVFNGDFVDRGSNGVEVMLFILSLKLAYPYHVHINRGNHEDKFIAMAYDFYSEVQAKYPGEAMFDAFCTVFAALPFAAVIPKLAFIVHGGLARAPFTLEALTALPRGAKVLSVAGPGADQDPTLRLLQDLLWSDFKEAGGDPEFNTARNAGCLFGPETTRQWLQEHGLRYLVRSHQCVQEGWDRQDTGEGTALYTVFSASNYPNRQGANLGAVLLFTQRDGPPEAVAYSGGEGEADVEGATRQTLVELICRHKHPLQHAFQAVAEGDFVGVDAWAAILGRELGLALDWRTLQPLLGGATGRYDAKTKKVVPSDVVNWRQFLNAFHVELQRGGGRSAITGAVVGALYTNQVQLAMLFRFLDKDGSGGMSLGELRAGCALLNARPGAQVLDADALFALLDLDKSGEINLNEFLEAFRISHAP